MPREADRVLVNARQAAPSRFAARPNPIIWRASACAGGGCSFRGV